MTSRINLFARVTLDSSLQAVAHRGWDFISVALDPQFCLRLRNDFATIVQTHADQLPSLARWRPNDVGVQRYQPGSYIGVTPHRDGKRFAILVAVFTIQGRARFAICRDRNGEEIAHWTTEVGDLVLLRGPELQPGRDDRPFHTASPPVDAERYSVALRMDTKLGIAPR